MFQPLFNYSTSTFSRNGERYNQTQVSYKGHIVVIEICLSGPDYLPRYFHTFLLDSNAVDPQSHFTLSSAMHRATVVLLALTQNDTFDNVNDSNL